VKLREKDSFRKSECLFFIEGARLCADASLSSVAIKELYVTEGAIEKYSEYISVIENRAERTFVVSDEVAEKLGDTKNPQGVFCVCKMLDKNTNIGKIKYNGKYIALENVTNPSNFGAVVRTAEAVGLDGVIVSGGCDIYNPKSQRAAMGSLFRLDVVQVDDLPPFLSELQEKGMKVYAGVPDSSALKITEADMSGGVVSIIGNEGNGITEETCKVSTPVTIPMQGRAESLNAAAAASILIWEMMR
jgi:TrmH family RNA methyltransferase